MELKPNLSMIFKTEPERQGFTSLHVTAILKNMRMSLFNQPHFMRPRYVLAGYSMPYSRHIICTIFSKPEL